MSVRIRLLAILGVSFALIAGILSHHLYRETEQDVRQGVQEQLALILQYNLAIRSYVADEIRPQAVALAPRDEFIPALMSTSFVARRVFDRVREKFPDYIIKYSAANPRNPVNLAGAEELRMIDYFDRHPDQDYWSGTLVIQGREYESMFFARRMTEKCLRCHGAAAKAPKRLIALYGDKNGYDIPLGKVIGLDTIAIPREKVAELLATQFREHIYKLGGAFLLFILVAALLIKFVVIDRLNRIARHFDQSAASGGRGPLSPLAEEGGDEFGRISRAYNLLTGRIEAQYKEMEESNARLSAEIASRKEVEERLRIREEYVSVLSDNAPDIIFSLDTQRRFTYLNRAVTELLGYESRDLLGQDFSMLVKDDNLPKAIKLMRGIIERGKVVRDMNIVLLSKEKDELVFNVSAAPLHDAEGLVNGLVGLCKDITRHKKLEQQMHQAQKLEAVGTLAGGLAHDFNNLLMGISGNLSLMEMDMEPESRLRDYAQPIKKCVQAGAALTAQLLGFARSGKYEVTVFTPHQTIDRALDLFSRTHRNVEIKRGFAPNLFRLEADEGQISQVLLNLLVNAGHAMTGGGELSISTENVVYDVYSHLPQGITAGHYVKISVTDTGTGISSEVLPKIFDPFFTTKEKGKGTGLGLASAYGIIKNHGGTITVYSEKGRGSTFNIYLPASEKHALPEENGNNAVPHRGSERILLVDDEDVVRETGSAMLQRLGYHILLAADGRDALNQLALDSTAVDLVILDLVMPGISGTDLLEAIKVTRPGVPVLIASGYSVNGLATAMLAAGCRGFIQKPFDLMSLSVKIKEIFTEDRNARS